MNGPTTFDVFIMSRDIAATSLVLIKTEAFMVEITGHDLDLNTVYKVATQNTEVKLSDVAKKEMQKSRAFIETKIQGSDAVYGVNTGFGALSSVKISNEKLVELQKNLIRSHCTGVGKPLSLSQTRAIMLLRANALARGHSGIRIEVVEKILEFLNKNIIPVIPSQGSVGASGDLAPLSHLALSLIGEGEVWKNNEMVSTETVLKEKKVTGLELQAKEGLSLINGCQVMTGIGLLSIERAQKLCLLADVAASMTLEALKGSRNAFDPLISQSRPHRGEQVTARNILNILTQDSEIANSHHNCNRVQDAYSLRCIPQVHGAVKDTIKRALEVLEIEANSSTDNPLVFADEKKLLSCGNFHGEPVAFQLDFMAIAVSELASLSERRIEKLTNPHTSMSDLPMFLSKDAGLNSGIMILQVTAASLVSENKILAHPASVDSIPTSADKEDHVSMGTIAARKLESIVENVTNVIAIELFCAAQALDFLRPLKSSPLVEQAYSLVRSQVPFAEVDRAFYKDIQALKKLIDTNQFDSVLKKLEV